MLVQDHLRLVEQAAEPTRLGRFRELPAGAAASHGRQRQHVELSGFVAGGQLELPAVGQSFAVVGFGADEFGNDEGDLQAPG